ncbi:hypothetical protein NOVOSPHI9U_40661 [Novosphingobium sp. 9U]|nr:hypothetical protein NOVOSPHI9U_40661 [Novosphingobium sp. 9U]
MWFFGERAEGEHRLAQPEQYYPRDISSLGKWSASVARCAPNRWNPFCYPVGPTVF